MDKLQWIKDLVLSEQKMEDQGIIDYSVEDQTAESLLNETIEFLKDIKLSFVESTAAFNELKTSPLSRIKIYGISNTIADFMLFRSGCKLIFSIKAPGQIRVYFSHIHSSLHPGQTPPQSSPSQGQETLLESKWGTFGDLIWMVNQQEFKLDYLVKHFLTRFVKESSR